MRSDGIRSQASHWCTSLEGTPRSRPHPSAKPSNTPHLSPPRSFRRIRSSVAYRSSRHRSEIEIAAGDLNRARSAADELARVATAFQSNALAASAALAEGRVCLAQRDGAGACRAFEAAVRQWSDIAAPYETALARRGLADALRAEGQDERALLELRAARATFERIGAAGAAQACGEQGQPGTTHTITRPVSPAAPDALPSDASVLCCEGDYWLVVFAGQTVRLRDAKGLRYLALSDRRTGAGATALELVALEAGAPENPNDGIEGLHAEGDAGPLLDVRAKEAYRRRLAEIDEDIADARAAGDSGRAAQAESEREFLVRELARAVGLGGRERRAGSASERERGALSPVPCGRLWDGFGSTTLRWPTTSTGPFEPGRSVCTYRDPRMPVAWKT